MRKPQLANECRKCPHGLITIYSGWAELDVGQGKCMHQVIDRDVAIKKLVKDHTYEEIGSLYDISRQRVEQIIRKFGPSTVAVARKRKTLAAKRRRANIAQGVI